MTESSLERMSAIFDVEPFDDGLARFAGDSDGGGRRLVDGSQILAQSIVAAGKALPGRTVRSAHALFVSVADPENQLEFSVAHPGIGTSQAHHTVSTAVMGIGISFHDPVVWDGWIHYRRESAYVGAGMSYVRGQVVTEEGRLLASFTQDAMIRAFEPQGSAASAPAESRL